ncbi:UNVERIFIED_CONTAM: NUDIX domain-containing protein [Williamsia faeni]
MTRVLVPTGSVPPWMRALTANLAGVTQSVEDRGGMTARLLRSVMPATRPAAVLVLISGDWNGDPTHHGGVPADATVLLTQRASSLRNHGGQIAFPGGTRDPGDDFPLGTAMREAEEETGLDPSGVSQLALLDKFPVPPSGFEVSPVIAYWTELSEVGVVDTGETSRVVRVPLRDLIDPHNRIQVERMIAGTRAYQAPAFCVDGMLVWGFTGGLLAAIIEAAGWEIPWDKSDVRDLEEELAKVGQ